MDDLRHLIENNPAQIASQLGVPVMRTITADEAKRESATRTREIFNSWTRLRDILDRHEATIHKRWTKKTRAARADVLLSAWPGMPSQHRPDFEALKKESMQKRYDGISKYREVFMWPHINVEDLAKPKTFLLLLKSRGRNSPDLFAHADDDAAHLGITSGALSPYFLNGHTMLLHGQKDSLSYGRIYSWDEDDDAFDWMSTRRGVLPGEGLQILEIQERIIKFLVKCCETILHDTPADSLLDSSFSIVPEPAIAIAFDSQWPKLATIAAEAPYRVPAHLDFNRLHALIDAKFSAAEDHVQSLHEDPGYFAGFVETWNEHRQEKIVDERGEKHRAFRQPSKNKQFWDSVLGSVIIDAYSNLTLWGIAKQKLGELAQMKETYATVLDETKKLPTPFHEAMRNFNRFLEHFSQVTRRKIKMGFPASPPIRHLFTRESQDSSNTKLVSQCKPYLAKDELLWLFSVIIDDRQLHLAGLSNTVDELQRLIENDAGQSVRISAWVADAFGDLAIVAELTRQMGLYQPWSSMIDANPADDQNVTMAAEPLTRLQQAVKFIRVCDKDFLSGGKFNYPSDKRRTSKSTETMRLAEANLDQFWDSVEAQCAAAGVPLSKTFEGFMKLRPLQRTTEWIEPDVKDSSTVTVQAEHQSLSGKPSRVDFKENVEKSLGRDFVSQKKAKVKKRREDVDHTFVPTEEVKENPALSITPTFTVGKRAYKTFSSLFYNPEQQQPPGEIPWLDFVSAMSSVGFIVEKLYGSVWQFTPTKLDVERNIQFHEPHPQPKIPITTARRYGRRLYRQYGWTIKTFVRLP